MHSDDDKKALEKILHELAPVMPRPTEIKSYRTREEILGVIERNAYDMGLELEARHYQVIRGLLDILDSAEVTWH